MIAADAHNAHSASEYSQTGGRGLPLQVDHSWTLAFKGCRLVGLEGDGHHTRAQYRKMHSTKLDAFSNTCLEETLLCRWLLDIPLSINVGCGIHKGMVTVRVRCRKKESLCGFLLSLERRLLVMTPAQNAFTGWDTDRLACWAKGLD